MYLHVHTEFIKSIKPSFLTRKLQRFAHHTLGAFVSSLFVGIAIGVRYSQVCYLHIAVVKSIITVSQLMWLLDIIIKQKMYVALLGVCAIANTMVS